MIKQSFMQWCNTRKPSLFVLLIMMIILNGMSLLFISQSHAKDSNSILILGDSLSASFGMKEKQGWVYILNQSLLKNKSNYTLINASISGETTGGGLARISNILSKQNFDYLLIELGGNDGLRGFPPALIKNNLLQIIQQAQDKNVHVMLMDIKIPPNYGPRYNQLFTDIFHQLAKESNIPLIPFFMTKIAVKPNLMQNDGIHPNQLAQSRIANIVKQQLDLLIKN